MASVMTSHHTFGGPPPLPSRGTNSNVTHVTVGHVNSTIQSRSNFHHTGRSASYDAPPPLPPTHSGSHNAHGGRSASIDSPPPVPPMSFRRRKSEDTTTEHNHNPPVPARSQQQLSPDSHPIGRRSIETKSFIGRHTARAYSNPDAVDVSPHDRPLPTLPPTDTIPHKKMVTIHEPGSPPAPPTSRPPRIGLAYDTPPELPPSRPHKDPLCSPDFNDFEKRFFFHTPNDFPSPEPSENESKSYPSRSKSVRNRTQYHQGGPHQNKLGSL